MEKEEKNTIWSASSLDAILITLWTLLIVTASASLLLKEIVSPQTAELVAQMAVVFFLLLTVYRLGVAYAVNALVYYTGCYTLVSIHAVFVRKIPIRVDAFIENASYSMIAFIVLLAIVRVVRYYRRKWNKKKNKINHIKTTRE